MWFEFNDFWLLVPGVLALTCPKNIPACLSTEAACRV